MSSSSSSGVSNPVIIPGMQDIFNKLLGLNTQNYQTILGMYGQGMNNIGNATNLEYNTVMNTLGMGQVLGQNGNWGVAGPAATAIGQAYDKSLANTTQQGIASGLGGTSLMGNLQNQNAQMASQSYAGLGSQLAQTAAGYQSNIMGAGIGMQNSLTQGLMGNLAGFRFNPGVNLTGQQSSNTGHSGSPGGIIDATGGGGGGRGGGSRGGGGGGGYRGLGGMFGGGGGVGGGTMGLGGGFGGGGLGGGGIGGGTQGGGIGAGGGYGGGYGGPYQPGPYSSPYGDYGLGGYNPTAPGYTPGGYYGPAGDYGGGGGGGGYGGGYGGGGGGGYIGGGGGMPYY